MEEKNVFTCNANTMLLQNEKSSTEVLMAVGLLFGSEDVAKTPPNHRSIFLYRHDTTTHNNQLGDLL
jgi:hypothetical protein